ncbi:MAG: L,D-transpeptidase [Chitinophagaceae bacterium]
MPYAKNTLFLLVSILLVGCKEQKQQNIPQDSAPAIERVEVDYKLISPKDSIKKVLAGLDSAQKNIVCAVNRVDAQNISRLDTIVMPLNLKEPLFQYLPYPFAVPYLKDLHKIIFFSYPAQVFGAYENGNLVYTGQTNMGRQKDPTPTGLFYTNWKAEKTISTVNDEWELKWNFNIQNDSGIGFHQYSLPGYPASHSCLRLTEKDAQYLYNWADQWEIKGTDSILAHGTPVIVFGTYPFGNAKPWFGLQANAHALDITNKDLEELVSPHLQEILDQQAKRAALKQ